jgi:ribosome-associated protein
MAKSTASRARRTPRLPAQIKTAIEAARDKKAVEVTVLDLRKTGAFTDYFVICTGANTRQVHAIADAVEHSLKEAGGRPSHVEGYERAEWILLDYFDFIVHVFSSSARQFYGLDRLWGNATRIELPDDVV